MADKVFYHGGEIEVRLGDVVETRILLFWRARGRIVYVPGVSPRHEEMEFGGLTYVGIRTKDYGMVGMTVLPETNTLKKTVKFISRAPDDDFEEVKPDEQLFEDEEGRPL